MMQSELGNAKFTLEEQYGSSYLVMKTLPYFFIIVLFILGCEPKSSYKPQTWWFDTVWVDESPVDTEIINKIYNAETIEDIFP